MNVYIVVIAAFGLSVGSFLNALIWRVKNDISILKGRSRCDRCSKDVQWFDNIPVLSFFLLRGKCRSCKAPIAWTYPMVELWGAVSFGYVAWVFQGDVPMTVVSILLISVLTFIFLYDLYYRLVHDAATLYPAILFAIYLYANGLQDIASMVIGVLVAAGFFALQFYVSKGKWIGGGDVRIGVLMGVVLGWPGTAVALFLSYVVGAVVSLALVLAGKRAFVDKTPFGTYLSAATMVTFMFGDQILGWYLNILF